MHVIYVKSGGRIKTACAGEIQKNFSRTLKEIRIFSQAGYCFFSELSTYPLLIESYI